MPQKTDAVIAELMDRRLLNDVDPDLHQEIAKAVVKAVHTASLQGEDAVERVKALAHRFWSIHPSTIAAMNLTREEFYAREMMALLATGLVPDEAAIRAELSEVRQEATDSLRVLDAIADYVGCPHDEELSVDHVRQHYMKLENAAQRQGIEDAARIANAQAYVTVNEAAIRADSTANLITIIADIREKTGLGGKPMLNELADAIVAEMGRRAADEREKCAETADCLADEYDATSFTSTNAEQVAALRSKEQAAHEIAAAIRSNRREA